MIKHIAYGFFTCLIFPTTTMATDNFEELKEYAASVVTSCVLSDGYVCEKITEDNFLSAPSQDKLIPAIYLSAWTKAYEAFNSLEDLTVDQKELKHYKIGFTETDADYIILFAALLLPARILNKVPEGFNTATFGRTTKFWINKETLSVTKHLYFD